VSEELTPLSSSSRPLDFWFVETFAGTCVHAGPATFVYDGDALLTTLGRELVASDGSISFARMRPASRNTVFADFAGAARAAVAVSAGAALAVALTGRRRPTAVVHGVAFGLPCRKRIAIAADTFASCYRIAGETVPRVAKERSAVAFASGVVHITVSGRHAACCKCGLTGRLVAKGLAAIRANALAARVADARGAVPPVAVRGFAAALEANVLGEARTNGTIEIRAFAPGAAADHIVITARTARERISPADFATTD
jgi:hypothetical protein